MKREADVINNKIVEVAAAATPPTTETGLVRPAERFS